MFGKNRPEPTKNRLRTDQEQNVWKNLKDIGLCKTTSFCNIKRRRLLFTLMKCFWIQKPTLAFENDAVYCSDWCSLSEVKNQRWLLKTTPSTVQIDVVFLKSKTNVGFWNNNNNDNNNNKYYNNKNNSINNNNYNNYNNNIIKIQNYQNNNNNNNNH